MYKTSWNELPVIKYPSHRDVRYMTIINNPVLHI